MTKSLKLVSACLIGVNCRFDQKHAYVKEIEEMVKRGEAVPVCPEQLGGLPTPRLPAEIVGGDGEDVLNGQAKVIDIKGNDVTKAYMRGAEQALALAQRMGIEEAILKEKSPSCGSCWIYDGTFSGRKLAGWGVTAALLRRHGIKVYAEEAIKNK